MNVNESLVPHYAIHTDGKICGFFGIFRFLSNFYILEEGGIYFEGLYYPSVENAYQAAKWPWGNRDAFLSCTPGKAKNMGKLAPHFDNKKWDKEKYGIMRLLCNNKFTTINKMKQMLLMTDGYHLEERNSWSDRDWGTDEHGLGDNNLGKILMETRERIKTSGKYEF